MFDGRIADLIDDRPADGVFRVNRAIYDDAGVFDLEMRRIFEGGWVFLGLASQAPAAHDFFTTTIGRTPVLVSRDGAGELRGFVNACPHRGAMIAQTQRGNARLHVCAYHSWTFDSAGTNKNVKWKKAGCYAPAFDDDKHDLAALPAFGAYKGFLFGSLVPTIPLADHLGEAAKLIDLIADQSEEGVELVPGGVTFTYDGNWKLQLENCSDAYHFTSAHPSYIRIVGERQKAQDDSVVRSVWENSSFWQGEESRDVAGGSYSFDHGHVLNWGVMGMSDALPLYESAERLGAAHGEDKRNWMFNMRNLSIFPNLQIAENASSQLRVIRPLAAGKTEMRTWCIAPKGESATARRQRIRQYEDFFNPSGMATPDDTVSYENCQRGFASRVEPWLQGYARGMEASRDGGNALSDCIGMTPARSVLADAQLSDETLFHSYYREWARRMAGAFGA